jgi:UDPglucose 6-dehydrogenase
MKIGIIGLGMVGESVAFGMRRVGHHVVGYDINPKRTETTFDKVLDTDLIFVCVPTPTTDGFCNASTVRQVLDDLDGARYRGLVVIKSTVPPGFTAGMHVSRRHLQLAFCPEFLRERARFTDFVDHQELCIAGVFPSVQAEVQVELIKQAHGTLPKNFVVMTPTEAELSKYFVNCFNAQRVVFANAFYDVCRRVGANYTTIKNAVTLRSGIGPDYLTCNEQTREFGGACLPKDTLAFSRFVRQLDVATKVFDMIVEENNRVAARRLDEIKERVA